MGPSPGVVLYVMDPSPCPVNFTKQLTTTGQPVRTKRNAPFAVTGAQRANICDSNAYSRLIYMDTAEECPGGYTDFVVISNDIKACYK